MCRYPCADQRRRKWKTPKIGASAKDPRSKGVKEVRNRNAHCDSLNHRKYESRVVPVAQVQNCLRAEVRKLVGAKGRKDLYGQDYPVS